MHIKLDENGNVNEVVWDTPNPEMLVGFIEVDEYDEDCMFKRYDSSTGTLVESDFSIRTKRNLKLITEVDPIVTNPLRWNDMSTEQRNAWSQYRTDLLNISQQSGFPENVTWPTKPE